MNIVSPYPLWYFLFCLIIGTVLSFLLYRKDRKLIEFPIWVKTILFSLRFLFISLLTALLLSPLVKYLTKTVEKPIIIIAHDNSASMRMANDSTFIMNEFQDQLQNLQSQLSEKFKVDAYQFDNQLNSLNQELNFDGKLSDFDILFEELENKYANRNIGGLVLISDGIYNQGSNPSYAAAQLDYPIFSVATGDTTAYVDARISNVRNNKLAFLGNDFPVEFDVTVQKAKIGTQKVSIRRNGKQLYSENVRITKSNQSVRLKTNLKAEVLGKQKYTVSISPIEGERNVLNNRSDFYIDILDGRQKVLLLATAPHPDLSAIRDAISISENYELKTELLADFKEPIKSFDLIVLHQSANASNLKLNQKLVEIIQSSCPLLIIGGGWQNLELQLGITDTCRRYG